MISRRSLEAGELLLKEKPLLTMTTAHTPKTLAKYVAELRQKVEKCCYQSFDEAGSGASPARGEDGRFFPPLHRKVLNIVLLKFPSLGFKHSHRNFTKSSPLQGSQTPAKFVSENKDSQSASIGGCNHYDLAKMFRPEICTKDRTESMMMGIFQTNSITIRWIPLQKGEFHNNKVKDTMSPWWWIWGRCWWWILRYRWGWKLDLWFVVFSTQPSVYVVNQCMSPNRYIRELDKLNIANFYKPLLLQ